MYVYSLVCEKEKVGLWCREILYTQSLVVIVSR